MITLRLDKNGGINKGDVVFYESDNISEKYVIQLYKNNKIYDLTGKTIELTIVEKKRKYGNIFNLPIENATEGKFRLLVTSDISKECGLYDFKVTVKDDIGLVETFPSFQVEVLHDLTRSIASEIVNSDDFEILTEGLKALSDYNIYKTNAMKVPSIEENIKVINSSLDTIALSKTNWINVVENGVDNSGLKDVTIKLQDLIDSYEGYVIYLPKGIYLISQIKLPKGTTLLGDGINSTILKGTSATDMVVLKDYLSAHVKIKDIFIDGDYKANRGVFAYKEQYSLEYLDNAFNMDNVYVKRCNIANVQIGKDGTASIMECKITNVKCEQGNGYGIYLANKCTDSYFEGLYCASNKLDGYYIEGFNLKFVNCKACWNGTLEDKKNGFYITKGGFNTFSNCESQDNYGHGVMLENTVNLNGNFITDRNGNGGFDESGEQIAPLTPTQYGIYIKNSRYIKINTLAINGLYTSLKKYTQKACVGIVGSYYITCDIQASNHPYYYIVEDKSSYNLDMNINGLKWQNILPTIKINDTTQDGLTFKQINNETFLVNGTALTKTKIDLLGSYGNTTPLLTIPKGSILKIKNCNKECKVYLVVVGNRTSILANVTNEAHILIEEDTDLSEVALQVNNSEVINNVIASPSLEIIPIGI